MESWDGIIPKSPEEEDSEFAEKARNQGVPLIPRIKKKKWPQQPLNKVVAVCGECGRNVYEVEGYACLNTDCPVQLQFRSNES